jgi:hypothetical protein
MTEAQEQQAVVEYCDWKHIPVFHIPSGGSRHPAEAAHLKAQGVRAGVRRSNRDLIVLLGCRNEKAGWRRLRVSVVRRFTKMYVVQGLFDALAPSNRAASIRWCLLFLKKHHEEFRQREADKAAAGEGEDPSNNHVLGNVPLHVARVLRCADAHDGRRRAVRGGNGHARNR